MVVAIHNKALPELLEAWDEIDDNGRDLAGIGALCLEDRYYLLVKVLRRTDCLHPWILARCREVEADPDDRLDLWAREHFKSTIITFAGSIQEILRDPEITIGIFSHTRSIALKFLRQIKLELERNTVLQRAFPEILYANPASDSPRWSEERGLQVKRESNPKEATIEAWGLVDSQPTAAHFSLRIYDDVVTRESVNTPEQVAKTTEAWELSDNLGTAGGRKWHIGTRYCTVGGMKILMSDWSHRPIEQVQVGDVVVGWELRDGSRWLRPARVINRGMHSAQPVNRYTFENERSVICTADHKWWRGPHGGGPEYAQLALPAGKRPDRPPKGTKAPTGIIHIRQLLVPVEPGQDRDSGWLAGGWRERYRFLALLNPTKRAKLAASLFGQLQTDGLKLTKIEQAGEADVHWLETETGNYVVEGFCSSNSFADTYQAILDRGALRPRLIPATADGTADGDPVLLTRAQWEEKKIAQGPATIACQQLQNPIAGQQAYFDVRDLQVYEIRPHTLNVYLLVDPARSKKKGSANSAYAVIGVDAARNKYLLDGFNHRMDLRERWEALERLYLRWINAPGVQVVRVGYEAYGAQADMDYFTERMQIEEFSFPIEALRWPREGEESKDDRVQRLGPDFRSHRFYLPYSGKETSLQTRTRLAGQPYRLAKPIKGRDSEGNLYDLSEHFRTQVTYYPFAPLKDLVDAASRIYDMDVAPPVWIGQDETEPATEEEGY